MNQTPEQPLAVAPGDRVWIELLKDHGIVRSVSRDGKRAVVETDKIAFNSPVAGLERPRRVRPKEPSGSVAVRRPVKRGGGTREIDMHGLRVEEMIIRLDRFLNDALLAGCEEVRVVHGHGTGALRNALHKHLRGMGVRHFRLGETGQTPGGDGVTIVSL